MWSNIPIIDLSAFGTDDNDAIASECKHNSKKIFELEQQKAVVAKQLYEALSEIGFVYIKNHGCPESIIQNAFKSTNQFFDLSHEEKKKMDAKKSPLYRGYNDIETGAHSCTPEDQSYNKPDFKESFTIGAEETQSSKSSSPMHGPNVWPEKDLCPRFKEAMMAYWSQLKDNVAVRFMKALAMSLDLDDIDFFCSNCDNPVAQMVLLRYPPNPGEKDCESCSILSKRRGCGAHTDCGFLTILAQDETAGLEVKRCYDDAWISAPPIPGTFVVNLGDMAARWTNDLYKSTEHRVTNASSNMSRHSIPFFINSNFDTVVECLTTQAVLMTSDNDAFQPRYPPVKAGEYILQKLGLMHMIDSK